jgi:hypothetical protein
MTDHAQKVSFYCERTTTEQLADLARDGERTLSGEIRLALREHLVRSQDPDAFSASSPRSPAGAVGSGPAASAGASARGEDVA